MEHLFVVIRKDTNGKYDARIVFTDRRLADNSVEIYRALDTNPPWEYFVIEGTVPETPSEAGTRLGAF
jgi:hypothetical protein